MSLVELKERIGDREAVSSRIILLTAPVCRIVSEVAGILEPAAFCELVHSGTADRIVLTCPRHLRKELRNDIAFWSFLDMLPVCPPAEIVCLLQFLVRTLEERNIILEELLSFTVVVHLNINFLISGIELGYIISHQLIAVLINLILNGRIIASAQNHH